MCARLMMDNAVCVCVLGICYDLGQSMFGKLTS